MRTAASWTLLLSAALCAAAKGSDEETLRDDLLGKHFCGSFASPGGEVGKASAGADDTAPCLVYETTHYGFCHNLLGVLMTATVHNRSLIFLDETRWSYKCKDTGSWSHFFQGSLPRSMPHCGTNTVLPDCARTGYAASHTLMQSWTVSEAYNGMGRALRHLWQPSKDMEQLLNLQHNYFSTLRKPVLAVHVRAGDKFEDEGRKTDWYEGEDWIRTIERLLAENDMALLGSCLVYGDDLSAMQKATASLVKNVGCFPIQIGGKAGGHWQAEFNGLSNARGSRSLCEATTELLLDLHALANADLFIGDYSSNIPNLVHLMREHLFGRAPSTGKDVLGEINWHFDWTVRRKAWHA